MNTDELKRQVEVILSQSDATRLYEFPAVTERALETNRVTAQYDTARRAITATAPSGVRQLRDIAEKQLLGSSAPSAFVWECDGPKPRMVNEQVIVLRVLYAGLDDTNKSVFPAVLSGALNERNAVIVAHVLVELRLVASVGNICPPPSLATFAGMSNPGLALWHGLRLKLALEPELFTDGDIRQLGLAADGLLAVCPPSTRSNGFRIDFAPSERLATELRVFKNTVKRVDYSRIRHRLLAAENPEVNTDREVLLSRMQALGFPAALETALDEVNQQLRDARTPLKFKQCMDLLRTVLERFTEHAAERVAEVNHDPLPPASGPRKFSECNNKLVKHKLLTIEESAVTQALANYLSQAGVHALSTEPEQVRVCRTTVVEWTMMVAGRLQQRLR